jgi:very-short-patch-repair endonuclease
MRDKGRTHQPLAALAKRQHGVVSVRQLIELGYSRHAIARANASGRLHRLHRGVYAVGHGCLSWHGNCLAAVLACGPGAVTSHACAAWLWDLAPKRPATIHVTTMTRRHTRPGMRIHFARLGESDRARVEDIPATTVPRTLLDLAATLSPTALDRAIERAEARDLFDLRAVASLLDRAGRHPGRARLRHALAIYRDEPAFTRSRLERRFLETLRKSGLPEPSVNRNVAGYELDFYWEAERFAVELDVYETHGSRMSFETDRARDVELKLAGVDLIRVTGNRLEREPVQTIESLATLLEARAEGSPSGVSAGDR